jgi:hypothetical protein
MASLGWKWLNKILNGHSVYAPILNMDTAILNSLTYTSIKANNKTTM